MDNTSRTNPVRFLAAQETPVEASSTSTELLMEGVIPRRPGSGPRRMSFAQQRLWFLEQLAPGNPVYNIFEALDIKGPLNIPALDRGLAEIVRRHECLRTIFFDKEGEPYQEVRPAADLRLELVDLCCFTPEEREKRAQQLSNEEAARPFDLRRDLMLRAKLLKLAPEQHVLVLTMHHIASDGWSIGILLDELARFYNATLEGKSATLPELPIQYSDFAAWQHEVLESGALQEQTDYWKQQLAGAPEMLEFPTDRPRPAVQSLRGDVERVILSPSLSKRLKEISRNDNATLFMTLMAAFNALLHRLSRQNDIVIGTPIAGRNHFQTENLIGFFINTLALRTDLSNNPSFRELLRRIRATTLDAYANQDLPFDRLVAELQPERSSSHTPVFQVLFAFQNGLARPLEFKGLTFSHRALRNGTAKFDLTLMMVDMPEGLIAELEYNRDLFDTQTAVAILQHFKLLLQGIAEDPHRRLSDLPLLSPAERQRVLEDWNSTAREYPRDKTVHEIFEAQAMARPRAVAVQADKKYLTYAELNAAANQLAHELQQQGISPGECVGIYLERGIEMIVSMLAILKAGAAYLPLDRAYPKDRLAFMLEDAKVRLLLTAKGLAEQLPIHRARVIEVDTEAKRIRARSSKSPLSSGHAEALAYVIYTSGSTGRPKGACIPHRAITRLVVNTDYIQLGPTENIAQVSNCSFDAATFEIWGALLNGGRLTILSNDVLLSPPLFQRALERHQITALFLTTSLFHLFAREMPGCFRGLRQLLVGGEAADARCWAEVLKADPPGVLSNVYGPTETTTFATVYRMKSPADVGRTVPIGRPIANTTTYILDEYMQPVPIGVPGELYIGGEGVGLGYLNRPELTPQKFVPNPFGPGRLYKTGDLARFLRDGNIEFIGRIDLQVKIRGFRVELGEVEELLSRHPGLKQVVVAVREDIPGQKTIAAYVVPKEQQDTNPEVLSLYLKEKLPDYMVPSAFVILPALPLNANGKVDRQALPEPLARPAANETYQAPRDLLEQQLAVVWEDVLHRSPIGLRDNFFQLGGHSLLAVQLALRLERVLGKRLLVSTFFQAPTIEQLAAVLRSGEERTPSAIVEVQGRGSKPPIFLVHGVGGGMFWGYRNLSRYLGEDQPVYVIRSRAMDGREEEYDRLQDMAVQYVAEMRAFQPRGPYYLGGYCFGGNVAYEMARQLTEQGESVAFLALMNCAPPNSSYIHVRWTPTSILKFLKNLWFLAGNALQWRPEQRREFLRWKARLWQQRLWQCVGWEKISVPGNPIQNVVDLSIYPPEQRRLWEKHIQALLHYHPKPFEGTVTLFRARAHPFLCSFDARCGWADLARSVDVRIVNGPHEGILDEPHVQGLAREMQACLEAIARPAVNAKGTSGGADPGSPVSRTERLLAPGAEDEVAAANLAPLTPASRRGKGAQREQRPEKPKPLQLSPMVPCRAWLHRLYSHSRPVLVALIIGLILLVATVLRLWEQRRNDMVNVPEQTNSESPVPTDAERYQILVEWNATDRDFPISTVYPQPFAAQVAKTPDAPALRWAGRELSYAALDTQSSQLAHLLQEEGVAPNSVSAIYLEHSLQYGVTLVAILKAGGAFLPLQPGTPAPRLEQILTDAQPLLVLTTRQLAGQLPQGRAPIICLDSPEWTSRLEQELVEPPVCAAECEDLAYVIYTSGSTGAPRGVEVSHRALLNHNYAVGELFELQPGERILQMAALSFDLSLEEILPPWLKGACVVLRNEDTLNSTATFWKFVEDEHIQVLDLPTVFWQGLVQDLNHQRWPESVRLMVIGGDAVSQEAVQSWKRCVPAHVKLINTYGPTETTIISTFAVASLNPEEKLTIGSPIPNTRIYILDQNMRLVPPGVPGELHIGGAGLARGYRNSPDSTAAKFVPDPFRRSSGERVYRTGDLARWRPDGTIEFLGRTDDQVKVRGYRIECGEIETVLKRLPGIKDCLVIPWKESGGDTRLVAYYREEQPRRLQENSLDQFLRRHLPEYMVPWAYLSVPNWPLTSHGKLDRAALPKPGKALVARKTGYVAPTTAEETALAQIWTEVLRREPIGIHDHFLDLGGNSLDAMQITSRICHTFQVDMPVAGVFTHPTIAALASAVLVGIPQRRRKRQDRISVERPEGPWPLSFAQQRLWFLDQMYPGDPSYNLPQGIRLHGPLDTKALERALREILNRQRALRSTVFQKSGVLEQRLQDATSFALRIVDLQSLRQSERTQALETQMLEEARRPFNLTRDLMMRAVLYRLAPTEHVLLITFHHIAADAWSIEVFVRDLKKFYGELQQGRAPAVPELAVQYADYAAWEKEELQGEVLAEKLDYWKKKLADAPALLELPTDRPRPAEPSGGGARQCLQIKPSVLEALRKIGQREDATLFMMLSAAFNAFLHRSTGREDLLIASPVANRTGPELEPVMGFFANTLPLRLDLSGDPPFVEVLRRTRGLVVDAYAHQEIPFEKIVEALHPKRDPSYHPIFQIMFALQQPLPETTDSSGLHWQPIEIATGTSKFDLMLELSESKQALSGWFEYSTDLFDRSRIERMAANFQILLEGIAASPERRVSELPLLSPAEERLVLHHFNANTRPFLEDVTVVELFEAQVEKNPQATALVFGTERLTYAELNSRANKLAHNLRSLGVGPEALVALCLERSIEMVVGILGVLKAGGAYVPMDPAYPAERLEFMLQDANSPVLLTQQKLLERIPVGLSKIICLDGEESPDPSSASSQQNPKPAPAPNHLAYIIYTSGSTGRPKGVALEHRSVNALVHWARELYSAEELAGVLFVTSICFDLSVFEMFVPLSWGGKVILAERGMDWAALPAAREVTLVNSVPSLMAEWLRGNGLPDSIITVNLAGEPLAQSLVDQIYERCPSVRQVYDLYGPTEDTVYTTVAKRARGGRTTIGRPLSNKQVYLLDHAGQPVPLGVPGEIYIGGTGLARGYLNRPELTAEKFVPNPFAAGERLYRTGDLARFYDDGELEFLGRIDHQVKIRGFRIELGEIEARLRQHPALREALVMAREDDRGEKMLVAYVAPKGQAALETQDLREFLKRTVPEYMVPPRFINLPAFPMTPNGKIDRKALPSPEPVRPELQKNYVAPRTELEQLLAGIWCEVLGIEKVGIYDHFFELGGHSLLAMQMLSRIRDTLEVELPMRAVFETPSIASLALQVEQIMVEQIRGLSEDEAERLAESFETSTLGQSQ